MPIYNLGQRARDRVLITVSGSSEISQWESVALFEQFGITSAWLFALL